MVALLAELKRRNIYRVGAAYAVVGWVLLQLVANVAPILDLPPWVARTVLLLIILGFPVALVFAWVRELAPESGAPARASTGKLDWFLAAALLVVIALVSYEQLAPSFRAVTAQQAGVSAARQASLSPAGAISLAVLPFANMSGDASQEFFSDGMTEEITSALAKVPDLRVVGRTSAFQFKGQNQDLRSIGQSLSATHLIEGSVRKVGDRVRITVQLIKTDDGTHIWSEDYDRQITDIFATQEDIARAITTSLRMPLGLRPGENLVNNRSIDPASYQEFLRAKALVLSRTAGAPEAVKILEPLVARYPNYAPAWMQLASAYIFANRPARNVPVEERRRIGQAVSVKVDVAIRRALALDPSLASGYAMLGAQASAGGNPLKGQELFSKALAMDPDNSEVLNVNAHFLAMVGRLKDALTMRQQLRALEPFVPVYNGNLADILWLNGQDEAAIALYKELPAGSGDRPAGLARIYASQHRFNEAAEILRETNTRTAPPALVDEAIRLLRSAPAKTNKELPRLETYGFIYLYVGAPDRLLEWYEENAQAGNFSTSDFPILWHPSYAPVRKTERFKALVRKAGLVDYWRSKGWPPLCHPTTGDDFVCE